MPAMTSAVTRAESGAASSGVSGGTCDSMPKTMGITVTGISMITVPETVGVRIRRSSDNRHAIRNWKRDEITTRVASMAGPPWAMAATQIAMKAPEVPMTRT